MRIADCGLRIGFASPLPFLDADSTVDLPLAVSGLPTAALSANPQSAIRNYLISVDVVFTGPIPMIWTITSSVPGFEPS